MDKGILIRTGSHCLYRAVYSGNCDAAYARYLEFKAKYPGLRVTYHEANDAEFVNTVVTRPDILLQE